MVRHLFSTRRVARVASSCFVVRIWPSDHSLPFVRSFVRSLQDCVTAVTELAMTDFFTLLYFSWQIDPRAAIQPLHGLTRVQANMFGFPVEKEKFRRRSTERSATLRYGPLFRMGNCALHPTEVHMSVHVTDMHSHASTHGLPTTPVAL